ncbi:MAG TPA: FdrA family protein [Nocardioidaceae bacterium]|nr:FdrA family protein [Nocardioidaceae bacterium]
MTDLVEVRRGAYYDSVSLMQVSKAVRDAPGISAALVAMATDLNIDLLAGMGFTVAEAVGPNDMLVAFRGEDQTAIEAGTSALDAALAGLKAAGASAGGFGDAPPPRTLGTAAARGGANLALISVPGVNAFVEAMDAVTSGLSVVLFSDNVSVEQEIALKDAAAASDVLVMGPDCGTAVVAGVALGFANLVRAGSVGLVAASGTGAQQVMCLLDIAGVGMSHCLGVGGRDLSSAVGGRSTRQALAALAADPSTESIIVVSKPPADEVLAAIQAYAGTLGKPVHWAILGAGRPDLTAAVEAALPTSADDIPVWPQWISESQIEASIDTKAKRSNGFLRGLFCGGTLADEAMIIASERLGPIRSNIPLSPELALGPDLNSDSHAVIDFGDDRLTRGRPHPMIDPSLRLERIAVEGDDPTCAVLLLDLVLGFGSHPAPAEELAAAIAAARKAAASDGRELPVVVSLIGVENDPQGLTSCAKTLQASGASVFVSNARATRRALSLLASASAANTSA